MSDQYPALTPEQLEQAQQKLSETKRQAEKMEEVLHKSAVCLVEAKESLIVALIESDVDVYINKDGPLRNFAQETISHTLYYYLLSCSLNHSSIIRLPSTFCTI